MSFLIDSNVLISSYDQTEEQHECSYALVECAMNRDVEAVVAQQNFLEYLAVVTDTNLMKYGFSPMGVLLCSAFCVLRSAFYVLCSRCLGKAVKPPLRLKQRIVRTLSNDLTMI